MVFADAFGHLGRSHKRGILRSSFRNRMVSKKELKQDLDTAEAAVWLMATGKARTAV